MITLYGAHGCPRCQMLASMMAKKHMEFVKNEDIELIKAKNFDAIPILELEDGTLLDCGAAVKYINRQE